MKKTPKHSWIDKLNVNVALIIMSFGMWGVGLVLISLIVLLQMFLER